MAGMVPSALVAVNVAMLDLDTSVRCAILKFRTAKQATRPAGEARPGRAHGGEARMGVPFRRRTTPVAEEA